MSLRSMFRDLLKPAQEPPSGYREPAKQTPAELVREISEATAAIQFRVRVLEAQLISEGRSPIVTPTRDEVLAIVDVLEGFARGESPALNTVEILLLASTMRGLLDLGD